MDVGHGVIVLFRRREGENTEQHWARGQKNILSLRV